LKKSSTENEDVLEYATTIVSYTLLNRMLGIINQRLNEMRIESGNSGGFYHFSKLSLSKGLNLKQQLSEYFKSISQYANPTILVHGKELA